MFRPISSQRERDVTDDMDERERKVSSGSMRSWASASPCSFATDISGGSGVTSPSLREWNYNDLTKAITDQTSRGTCKPFLHFHK